MDVVRANIERIGGVVDLDSRISQGVKLCIRVPLTLTIIPALTVSAGGQIFAIPRSAIDEIWRVGGGAVRIDKIGEAEVATVRGRRVPLIALAALLGVEAEARRDEQRLILLKPAGGDVYALAVDAVHDHEELVVKPAAPAVMAAGLYAGTTLADDGRPILLLDPSGMAKCAGVDFDESRAGCIARAERRGRGGAAKPPCSCSARSTAPGVPCRSPWSSGSRTCRPKRFAVSAGKLRVALAGRILPLAGCDAAARRTDKLRILRLTDGVAEIAYGFAEVIDIRAVALDLQPASAPGEVGGVALIDGEQVETARSATGCSPLSAMPRRRRSSAAGLRAARGRSLDGEYAPAADREPRLSRRRRMRRRGGRYRHRRARAETPVRSGAGEDAHSSLRPRRADQRARPAKGRANG